MPFDPNDMPAYGTQAYGGPAMLNPEPGQPLRQPVFLPDPVSVRVGKRHMRVAAHVDRDGVLRLKVQIDGELVGEVETAGTTVILEAKV